MPRRPREGKCLTLSDMEPILADSRDPEELKRIWVGWHTVSPPYRQKYARFVELSNKGAKEMGFKDVGAMWRAKLRHAARRVRRRDGAALAAGQAALRLALHLHAREAQSEVRRRGRAEERAHPGAPARQHVEPGVGQHLPAARAARGRPRLRPDARSSSDATPTPKQMVRYGEGFFTSLGFEQLPADLLGALAVCEAARPRGRLPRQRVGHRRAEGRAPQDVHQDQRGGLLRPSTTSWDTTTTRWPTPGSRRSSRRAPTTASTRPSATPSRSRSRPNTSSSSGSSNACPTPPPTRGCCCAARSTRSPSCPSATS